eukprot:1631-Heterococcus_DN1.PRE.1
MACVCLHCVYKVVKYAYVSCHCNDTAVKVCAVGSSYAQLYATLAVITAVCAQHWLVYHHALSKEMLAIDAERSTAVRYGEFTFTTESADKVVGVNLLLHKLEANSNDIINRCSGAVINTHIHTSECDISSIRCTFDSGARSSVLAGRRSNLTNHSTERYKLRNSAFNA